MFNWLIICNENFDGIPFYFSFQFENRYINVKINNNSIYGLKPHLYFMFNKNKYVFSESKFGCKCELNEIIGYSNSNKSLKNNSSNESLKNNSSNESLRNNDSNKSLRNVNSNLPNSTNYFNVVFDSLFVDCLSSFLKTYIPDKLKSINSKMQLLRFYFMLNDIVKVRNLLKYMDLSPNVKMIRFIVKYKIDRNRKDSKIEQSYDNNNNDNKNTYSLINKDTILIDKNDIFKDTESSFKINQNKECLNDFKEICNQLDLHTLLLFLDEVLDLFSDEFYFEINLIIDQKIKDLASRNELKKIFPNDVLNKKIQLNLPNNNKDVSTVVFYIKLRIAEILESRNKLGSAAIFIFQSLNYLNGYEDKQFKIYLISKTMELLKPELINLFVKELLLKYDLLLTNAEIFNLINRKNSVSCEIIIQSHENIFSFNITRENLNYSFVKRVDVKIKYKSVEEDAILKAMPLYIKDSEENLITLIKIDGDYCVYPEKTIKMISVVWNNGMESTVNILFQKIECRTNIILEKVIEDAITIKNLLKTQVRSVLQNTTKRIISFTFLNGNRCNYVTRDNIISFIYENKIYLILTANIKDFTMDIEINENIYLTKKYSIN